MRSGDSGSQNGDVVVLGTIATSLGQFGAVLTERGLARLTFAEEPFSACGTWLRRWLPSACVVDGGKDLDLLAEQLNSYLAGTLQCFSVPLDLRGSAFQIQAWQAVCAIEYGQVRSYAQVAASIDRPRAVRAVGAANGANPVPILVPCHRVIGSDGTLVGYGGGMELKRRLLQLEGVSVQHPRSGSPGPRLSE